MYVTPNFEQHNRVPERATLLIGPDQAIRYAWHTDDAYEKPEFFRVKEALDMLVAERGDLGYDPSMLSVEYEARPGEAV